MKHLLYLIYIAAFITLVFTSCKHDKDENDLLEEKIQNSSIPLTQANIFLRKCATAGCHNAASKDAAAGLNLETWEDIFKGGNGGAAIIPFRPDLSTMMYYVNHDSILHYPGLSPTMPVNQPPLSAQELHDLESWIAAGAPDKTGYIKFSDNPLRRKYYVTNQGCDLVLAFDAETNLAMRGIDVGHIPGLIESPHMVKVAPDNLSWFVCFVAGGYFQQYSTLDNTLIGEAPIGVASWNTFALSPDGQKAYVVDFSNGKLAIVDIPTMTVTIRSGFGNPHGSCLNPAGDTLYMTAQLGSYLFKIPVNDMINFELIDLHGSFPSPAAELQPHDVIFSTDHSRYFVTCDEANEVRVVDASNDNVIAAIPVDLLPQEMAVSTTHPYLFVTCMDAIGSIPSERGSVVIINTQTLQVIKSVYTGYQPHGIAVDDVNGKVYVANRNANPNGPAPHHTSVCGGRNGYMSIIDLNTLNLIPGSNTEISVDPYSVGLTH
jgi:YVTN family beta-propeller protein